MHAGRVLAWWVGVLGIGAWAVRAAIAPCRIDIVEQGSGWPVPLVELRTTHEARFVSDNAGVIAFDLPEGMGREMWFEVIGRGYEVPKDGFGYRGVRLRPEPGRTLTVTVARTMIARRLGRLTGAGLFGESQRLGLASDWQESGVFGCDSVQTAVYGERLFWAWGDTTLPHYPLGVFHMTGATTTVQPLATLEPPVRVRYDYFRDALGRPRGVAVLPGSGPTWVSAVVVLPDRSGRERLLGSYAKIKPPLEAYEKGLCLWNDATKTFDPLVVVWRAAESGPKAPPLPEGHAVIAKDQSGVAWVYFGNPLPNLRCRATFEAWQDPTQWETLVPPATLAVADEAATVRPHSGSIAWHPWRKRWVTVFLQAFGRPSAFGELWYAEADAPTGPWGAAVKVLTHDNYTFYNPRIHVGLAPADSPVLLFEGTYTRQFADRPAPTPRFDYNQVLYRLDLDAAALAPARR